MAEKYDKYQKIKRFVYGLFPKNMVDFFGSLIFNIRYKKILGRNTILKDKYKGETCFIVGNGPSLKEIDLKRLAGQNVFATNRFSLHKDFDKIKPRFYCAIDPGFFRESEVSHEWVESIKRKDTNGIIFFFPVLQKEFVEKNLNFLKKENIFYLSMIGDFKENCRFNIDISTSIPSLINVIQGCLIPAYYMGFEKIYLLGVEHDFAVKSTGHFYKGLGIDFSESYELCLKNVAKLFAGYRLLKKKFVGTEVYNLTPNSYLDVFEFDKYENVLKRK
jgi:hypothetical protein